MERLGNRLIIHMLPCQYTFRHTTPPLPNQFNNPPRKLINPTPSNHDSRHGVNQPNQQRQKATPLLTNQQHNRFDVILEVDARHVERVLGNSVGLAGCSVLVREDQVPVAVGGVSAEGAVDGAGTLGVNGGDDGEEVLVFVIVGFGGGDGFVEGVEDCGVVRAEGKFGDHVREVEGCVSQSNVKRRPSDWG